jgi:hypothetical protein
MIALTAGEYNGVLSHPNVLLLRASNATPLSNGMTILFHPRMIIKYRNVVLGIRWQSVAFGGH